MGCCTGRGSKSDTNWSIDRGRSAWSRIDARPDRRSNHFRILGALLARQFERRSNHFWILGAAGAPVRTSFEPLLDFGRAAGAPKGNRTPVFAVKGRRPGPLDDGRGLARRTARLYGAAARLAMRLPAKFLDPFQSARATADMKSVNFRRSSRPSVRTPVHRSRPNGLTRLTASAAFSADKPPARKTGRLLRATNSALRVQSCRRPVPPSSATAAEGRPESRRNAWTCGP